MKLSLPLMITAPAANARFCSGTQIAIKWNSKLKGAEPVRIEILDNNNAVYHTVASSAPNNGSYNWAIPANSFNQTIKKWQLRITAVKSNTIALSKFFYIGKPGLSIAKPTNNQIVNKRSTFKIQWQVGCLPQGNPAGFKIDLLDDNRNMLQTIANSVAFSSNITQSYNWLIPETLTNARHYIRITSSDGSLAGEQPILVTSMVHPWVSPEFTLTKPNALMYLCPGQTIEFRWQSTLPASTMVKIKLVGGGTYNERYVLAASTQNDGVYVASLPANMVATTYHFSIGTVDGSTFTESSVSVIYDSKYFTIAPVSGNTWRLGETERFRYWVSRCFSGSSLTVQLLDANNNVVATLATITNIALASVRGQNWTVPTNLNVGPHTLKIIDQASGKFATFNITLAYPQ
jgi:hypothetical protein